MSDPRKELKRLRQEMKELKAEKKSLITDALRETMDQISRIEAKINDHEEDMAACRADARGELIITLEKTPKIKVLSWGSYGARLLVGRKSFNISFNGASMDLYLNSRSRHSCVKTWKMTIKPQTVASQILAIAGEER